ncbi:hypothetical protein [Kineococcus terrestris]|uniref:hypothetical protein n=1 Tax=Kineococcus terrestris TaxID=2044856 RepID=UPI0034DB3E59
MRLAFWRRAPDPLGEGVWARAAHTVDRSVRRFEQVTDGCPPGPARTALQAYLPRVDLVARAARARAVRAQAEAPSTEFLVPAGPDGEHPEVHRRLTRTATACAQAAEAAALLRVGAGSVEAVERAVVRAEELAGLPPGGPPAP